VNKNIHNESFYDKFFNFPFLVNLKVHKIENFFGSDFGFCIISLLVMLKYKGFEKKIF
jgi:hypothetical protein